jgi:hypothetical protein
VLSPPLGDLSRFTALHRFSAGQFERYFRGSVGMVFPLGTSLPRQVAIGLVSLGVTTACLSVTGPGRDVEPLIHTDATAYQLSFNGHGFTTMIPYVFDNRTDASVHLHNCNGAFAQKLERLERGKWVVAWYPALPLCLSAPIVVDPGDTFATELRVWGARPNQNFGPAFDVADPSGTYRLVWDAAAWSRQNGSQPVEPMPLEYRISNRFVLTVQ